MIDLTPFGDFIREFGLPLAGLIVLIVTGARGMWIFIFAHNAIVAGKDEVIRIERERGNDWKTEALAWRQVGKQGVAIAEKAHSSGTNATAS